MVKEVIKISTFGLVDLTKGKPGLPTEDARVTALRERQFRDLAELDEEENRRLKSAFRSSRGIRAFRRSGGSTSSVSSSAGQAGQRAFQRGSIR